MPQRLPVLVGGVQSFRPIQISHNALPAVALATWIVALTSPCAAQIEVTAHLHLRWTAPPECPASEQISEDVRGLLGQAVPARSAPINVEASIQAIRDGRYALVLTANGQSRRLTAGSCKKLAQAAALLLAILVDPSRSAAYEGQSPAPESDANATPPSPNGAQPSVPAAAQSTAPTPTRRDHEAPTKKPLSPATERVAMVELAGRLDVGSWPEAEPAALVGVGLRGARWRVLGHAGLGRRFAIHRGSNADLELTPVIVNIEPALRFVQGRWALEPGVGFELGITHSRSADLEPKTRDAVSVAIVALTRGVREIGWGLGAWIALGAGFPLLRPRWTAASGEIYHAFGPSIRGELGLQMAF